MKLSRIDLSENLIHFVSALDRSSIDYGMSEMHPKEFGMSSDIVEDNLLSPFFILRRIIRHRQILSTWSYRKGQRTIYGEHPAVCFTEMPISEFVKTSIDRQSKGQKISNYGLIFNKKELFKVGARPVIYGCSVDIDVIDKNEARFLSPPIFDNKELYRFVAYKLDRLPYPIDWTHEREWRWPNYGYLYSQNDHFSHDEQNSDDSLKDSYQETEEERISLHGLNIDQLSLTNIGIILKTEEQAKLIVRDILWLIDTKKIKKDTFGYVLFFNNLEKNIDKLIDSSFIKNEITRGIINLERFLTTDQELKKKISNGIHEICKKYNNYNLFNTPHQGGLSGLSYPCLNNNQDSVSRILIELDVIKITKLGRYLIDLPILHPTQCMENNEAFVKEVLNPELENLLGTNLTYYSIGHLLAQRLNRGIEIDDVPFYTDPNDDEWNYAHREQDY